MKTRTFISSSPSETNKIAEDFVSSLKKPTIVGLIGDLGTGKTTFVQSVSSHLGVTEPVTSPTFVLWRQYQTNSKAFPYLHHFDLYRLETVNEVKQLGIDELFAHPEGLILIEWSDKYPELFPEDTIWISFEYLGETKRKITIKE